MDISWSSRPKPGSSPGPIHRALGCATHRDAAVHPKFADVIDKLRSAVWKSDLYELCYNGCTYFGAYCKRKYDVYSEEKRMHKTRTYYAFGLAFQSVFGSFVNKVTSRITKGYERLLSEVAGEYLSPIMRHSTLGFGVVNGEFQRLYNAMSVAAENALGGGAILGDTVLLPVYEQELSAQDAENACCLGFISPDVSASDRKVDGAIAQILVPLLLAHSGYGVKKAIKYVRMYWPEDADRPLTGREFGALANSNEEKQIHKSVFSTIIGISTKDISPAVSAC